jgi:DNA polymerase III alpha subunit
MAKIHSVKKSPVQFSDVKQWFDENMSLDVIDLEDKKVYDFVYRDARWAGIFQVTNSGAQKFFEKASPRSIVDIAALTSIYRPGPLAANVDKLWLKHEKEPYDWGHPLINETLKNTRGLLVFQESVMQLAEFVGGFPKEQCDEVRRAIMKRSISGGEAAKQKAQELEDDFVKGAMGKGVPEDIAKKAYQTILFMSGYGFNASHALAYSIDSYYCAWLLTHHTEAWLTAYLEDMSSTPDNKAKALSEIKSMGYSVVPIDVNVAGKSWTVLPGKMFMPSLLSCKGIGAAAVDEVLQNRPYKSLEDMLWTEDGSWRHSKFNKRALESLVKIGGFGSFDCVGPDKLFSSLKHMHHVLIERNDEIKKTSKREPGIGIRRYYEIIKETHGMEEWTPQELVDNKIEVLGAFDITDLIPQNVMNVLSEKGVPSVSDYADEGLYWFVVMSTAVKQSKNGKQYLLAEIIGSDDKKHRVYVWSAGSNFSIKPLTPCLAPLKHSGFGFSTNARSIKSLVV